MISSTHPEGWPVIPLNVGGHRAAYSVRGRGSPLVLLPSLFALPRTYQPTANTLARHFRVYVLEVPGSGRSERLPRPWSLEEYARWLKSVFETLNLTDVTLVGHSHAGAVAMLTAALCPEHVTRLVLVDAIGSGERTDPLAVVRGGLCDLALDYALVCTAWPHVLFNMIRHPRNFLHHVRVCFTANVLPEAVKVRAKTLIAWGRRDHTIPLTYSEKYANALPTSRLFVSHVGSHNWLITDPDEFVRAVGRTFFGVNAHGPGRFGPDVAVESGLSVTPSASHPNAS